MKASDLAGLAARNFRESILRSSLTTAGIAVGVASLVAMLSLGIGLQRLADRRLERSGLFDSVIVLSPERFASFGPRRVAPEPQKSPPLSEAARLAMARLPGVAEAYPDIRVPALVRLGPTQKLTLVNGIPPSDSSSDAFKGMLGTFFSSPSSNEIILQTDLARELSSNPSSLLGRQITLSYAERQALPTPMPASRIAHRHNPESPKPSSGFSIVRRDKTLRIVGIVEREPSAGFGRFARAGALVPLSLAESMNVPQISNVTDALQNHPAEVTYTRLVVRVRSPEAIQSVEDKIKAMGFRTFSLLDTTRNIRRFFAVVDLLLGIFGSLALIVASLGIVNTLVMAILERRREIGIMKALGASDTDVRRLFFAEAAVMGAAGGALGVALGWAIGRIINAGANFYLRRQNFPPEAIWHLPWWLVAAAMAFSILVSLVAGIYPASRAAQLDPVQTLRYE
jgi:putative ABC transport system permease protein